MIRYFVVIAGVVGIALFAGDVDTSQRMSNVNVMNLAGEPPAAEAPLTDLPKQSTAEPGRGSALQTEPVVPAKIDAVSIAADDVHPATAPGGLPPSN